MKTYVELRKQLLSIDRKSYPAYKSLRGEYDFGDYILCIDHVQGDPFASPSGLSLKISGAQAAFPGKYFDQPYKKTAFEDFLLRRFGRELEKYQFRTKGSGKSGLLSVSRPGQEILPRNACQADPSSGSLLIHFQVGFPAFGRTIDAHGLADILFDFLVSAVHSSFYFKTADKNGLQRTIELAEDQQFIREQLAPNHLAAFVANGSILPRESGVSSRPMKKAIPFVSPPSMEVSLTLPHFGKITGMGIRQGITLIVGGGYHGKSTLLKALEAGVYNHIRGDGREFVITDDTAVKIRAEDGRNIFQTDISPFINNLPNGISTRKFSTMDASGSTSQAANVIEAMEAGTSLFLIDEDTSATNFMIRDELMQRVIHRDQEPITPFHERIRPLFARSGISCILVAGSFGTFFHVADTIIQMDRYAPKDITALAKREAAAFPGSAQTKAEMPAPSFERFPKAGKDFRPGNRIKTKVLGKDGFSINRETVDLRYVEQLCHSEQTAACCAILKYALLHFCDGRHTIGGIVEEISRILEKKGLDGFVDSPSTCAMALPRKQEIFACLNRYRGFQ